MKHSFDVCRLMRACAALRRCFSAVGSKLGAIAIVAVLITAGCAQNHTAQSGSEASTTAPASDVALGDLSQAAELDAQYLIGPTPARKLNYRIDWQTRTEPFGDSGVKMVSVQGDSIFVLDGENFLTRLKRDSGDRVWRLAIAEKIVEIHGITYMPDRGRVYLVAGASLLVLDSANGAPVGKHRLERIANTGAVVYGPMLIYGSRNGQLVWYSHGVGTLWKAYQIASTILISPVLMDDLVIVVGTGGRVAAISASQASMVWSKTLLDDVVAAPAAGNGHVYVAGVDQHIWAFDAASGRTIWRKLTESPLTESPVLMGDRLYQQVPSDGLVCLEAVPANSPGGKVIWTAADVSGSVVNEYRGILMAWDRAKTQMSLVSAGRGTLVEDVPLSRVKHLFFSSLSGGEMYAASDDGYVTRLSPRN